MRLNKAFLLLLLYWMSYHCGTAAARCPTNALARLPYVLEYAVWRGWHQAFIYNLDLEKGCQWALLRLTKCLGVNGIAVALNLPPERDPRMRSQLGIVILTPSLQRNATNELIKLIYRLHELEMNTASYDWLIATRSDQDFKFINEVLNASTVRFDQNIVVAYPYSKSYSDRMLLGICDQNFFYKTSNLGKEVNHSRRNWLDRRNCRYGSNDTRNCIRNEFEVNYYRSSERYSNLTIHRTYKTSGLMYPLLRSGLFYNHSRSFMMLNISHFVLKKQFIHWSRNYRVNKPLEGIHVIQYFKVRINSTLYAYFLGSWSRAYSMAKVITPYPVEARNFLGEIMLVGRCNATADGTMTPDDDGPSAPALLDDVLHFLNVRLNTTTVTKFFNKLGFRTYEGTWSGLLGALMEKNVDVALEPVTEHAPRHSDMDFIFPIAVTMCNIYIRQQETSTVRDIFLAPFSAQLIGCVVAAAIVASLTVVLISRLARSFSNSSDVRQVGYVEALIWSTGILCQQGGSWTPPTPSASVLLIVFLLFALVTYNAYAAFITSVLSVRVASVDTVAAVLRSPHLKIGYIRNGPDQMYLMSTKDVQLNEFYIRGYSDAENLVTSAEEGLERAAKQDYAFFAGQRAARTKLRSLSQARGRCALRELPVPSTRAQLAFPLPRRSPYAKPTLLSLLLLRGSGALARLEAELVPAMPQCAPPPAFASARASDVSSALILLTVGLVAAVFLGCPGYRERLKNIGYCLCRNSRGNCKINADETAGHASLPIKLNTNRRVLLEKSQDFAKICVILLSAGHRTSQSTIVCEQKGRKLAL